MTAETRLYIAVGGGVPDRVPAVPKIWVDLAATLLDVSLTEVVSSPSVALEIVAEAGFLAGADAVRQFHFPERRTVARDHRLFEVDDEGRVIGEIDLAGGLTTLIAKPEKYDLDDPRNTAYAQFRSAFGPLVDDEADAERIVVPQKGFYEETGCGERQRRVAKKYAGRMALIGDCGPATIAFLCSIRGMTAGMIDLIERPLLAHKILEKGARIAVEKGKFNLDLGLRVLRVNDSIGNMSVISPAMWREFVFPHLKDVCTELHAYDPGARVYCHICGNVLPVAEDLVETGLDCIGPLDPLGGFTPAAMRARVGDAVSLMGGVNTLSFINGDANAIVEESRRCIREAGEAGGYVLGSGCAIPRATPLENLKALRRAAEIYGLYTGGRLADNRPASEVTGE